MQGRGTRGTSRGRPPGRGTSRSPSSRPQPSTSSSSDNRDNFTIPQRTPPPGYSIMPVVRHSTRVPPHMRPRPSASIPPPQRRGIMTNSDWKNLQELRMKVFNLPPKATTRDLYELFKLEGTITRIEIKFESGGRVAYIVFSPPPLRAFWEDQWSLAGHRLRIEAREQKQFRKASPVNPNRTYPESMIIPADSVEFGFMYSKSAMMSMQKVDSIPSCKVTVTLNLRWAKLIVKFPSNMLNEEKNCFDAQQFCFELPIRRLTKIYEAKNGDEISLIIPFDCVPPFSRKVHDVEWTHDEKDSSWDESRAWFRQTDITHFREALKTAPTMMRKKNPFIDLGRWTTYKINFIQSSTNLESYQEVLRALTDWNVDVIRDLPIELLKQEQSILWDTIDDPGSSCIEVSPYGLQLEPVHLDFEVRYQLEACLSNNILHEHNITREFLERLATMNRKTAKSYLEVAMEKKQRFYEPLDIFRLPLGKKGVAKEIPAHCFWARAATITPTTLIISSPTMEISNRVIRDYIRFSDRFLRVKFTDEKFEGKLGYRNGNIENEPLTRVWRTLRNGITIGDRHYEFLAFGNSQFRESGAYFFSPIKSDNEHEEKDYLTASYIRRWMGDFSDIREVALYASRMGQCFSTTREVTGVKAEVKGDEDVRYNGYTFTDGVGKISKLLAEQVAEEFGHQNPVEDTPSVFQFRLGGCKGVLAVAPELEGHQIIVRRSQEKFPAPNDGLEVIKWSQYATATLNRQLIVVLDALGVSGHVFMKKLRDQLSGLTEAMTSEETALLFLQKSVDPNQSTLTLSNMILDGFMNVKEPFLMSVLHVWRAWSIKNLKEKAKLFVGDGAFLLGCTDETASLRGHYLCNQDKIRCWKKDLNLDVLPEIFVQISDPEREGHYKVIEGLCMIARNPSLHPGDIRIVYAVDKPQLHHLKNVIVFPQTGDRDIPNMCSGGDLDGDDYMVVWDKELIPEMINHSPMDFTPPEKLTVDEVHMEDIAKFFVDYIKNNKLGTIALAHLATADSEDEGVRSDKCLKLAQLHSIAVDYAKSGVPAVIPKDLVPKKYPHFMGKPQHKTYISRKILGKLYDAVEEAKFEPCYDAPFDSRVINAYTIEPTVLAKAAALKELYDAAIRRLMAQHDVHTEFEVWSTFVLQHNEEIRDFVLQEEFGRVWEALRDRFKKLCYEEAVGGYKEETHGPDEKRARAALQEEGRTFKNLGPFIAAMYTVTAQEMQRAVEQTRQTKVVASRAVPVMKMNPQTMPLMSFPWIFSRELGLIATGQAKDQREGLSIPHPATTKKKPRQKPKMDTATQGSRGWTKEDELFVDGKAVVKQGELLDLFGDNSGKAGDGPHQPPHAAPGKDTLKDVSSMPTEPTAAYSYSTMNIMKQLEGLDLSSSNETEPEKNSKPKKSKPALASKNKQQEETKGDDDYKEDLEGLYTDDGPYPPKSYKYPYFKANFASTDHDKHHAPATVNPADPNEAFLQSATSSGPAKDADNNDSLDTHPRLRAVLAESSKTIEELVSHLPYYPSKPIEELVSRSPRAQSVTPSKTTSIPPHLRTRLPLRPKVDHDTRPAKTTEQPLIDASPPPSSVISASSSSAASRPPFIPPHLRASLLPPKVDSTHLRGPATPASLMGLKVTQQQQKKNPEDEDEDEDNGDDDEDSAELLVGVDEETEVDNRKVRGRSSVKLPTVSGKEPGTLQSVAEIALLKRLERELEDESAAASSTPYESDKDGGESGVNGEVDDERKTASADDDDGAEGEEEVAVPSRKGRTAWDMLERFA